MEHGSAPFVSLSIVRVIVCLTASVQNNYDDQGSSIVCQIVSFYLTHHCVCSEVTLLGTRKLFFLTPLLLPWRKSAWRTTSLSRIPYQRRHHPILSPIGMLEDQCASESPKQRFATGSPVYPHTRLIPIGSWNWPEGDFSSENGLQYRRDATLREDHAQLRMGHAPQMLALLNNTVLGLFARQGQTTVAQARRECA